MSYDACALGLAWLRVFPNGYTFGSTICIRCSELHVSCYDLGTVGLAAFSPHMVTHLDLPCAFAVLSCMCHPLTAFTLGLFVCMLHMATRLDLLGSLAVFAGLSCI